MAELKLVVGADVTDAISGLKVLVNNIEKTTGAVQKFSTDVSSFGKLPLHNIENISKAFLKLKGDFSNVKFAAIPPVTADTRPAQKELKVLTDNVKTTVLSVGTISAAFDRFSTDVNKSLGALSVSTLNNFKKAFLDFKSDLSNVKISALPPVTIDTTVAKQSIQSFAVTVDKTLDGVRADLSNLKVAAIQPVDINTVPADQSLKGLVNTIKLTGTTIVGASASIEKFSSDTRKALGALPLHNVEAFRQAFLNFKGDLSKITVSQIPPIKVDVGSANQSLQKLSQEAEKTGVSVSNVAASFQRFSQNISRSFGALPLASIAAFRDAFQKFKSDLTNVKITAIPPIRVDTTQAQQSLQTLTEQSKKSSSSVSDLSAAYARWATIAANSSGTAAKSLSDVNSSLSVIGNTAKSNFGAIVVSMDQTSASVKRFGSEVNKSLGTLPLENVATFRQAFLDFKNDISNAKISAIPPITADIRPAQEALKTLTGEVKQSGEAAEDVSGVYKKWSGEVATSSTKVVRSLKDINTGTSSVEVNSKKSLTAVSTAISKIPPATRPAITAVSKLGDTLETLRAKLLARQNFLITEKDIARISVINREIRELQGEITRVKNIGSAGFDSLGNSVTKAGGSFGALSAGATKGFTALRTLANFIPGLGIGSLITLLTDAAIGLFKTAKGFDDAAISAAKFSQALKDAKSNLEGVFTADLDLTKLKNKLNLGEGIALLAANFKLDKTSNDKIIETANEEITRIVDRIGQLRTNAAFFLSKKGQQLLDLFPVDALIPDNLIDDLADQDKKIVRELKILGTRYESLSEERAKAFTAGQALVVQNEIETREALKKQHDKNLDDLKRFIDKAKQLNAELEKIGFIPPAQFSFFDTLGEELAKAKKVFDDFNNQNLKINPKLFTFPSFSEPEIKQKVDRAMDVVREGIRAGIIGLPIIPLSVDLEANIVTNLSQNAELIRDFTKLFQNIGQGIPKINMDDFAGFNEGLLLDKLRKFFKVGSDVTKEGFAVLTSDFRAGVDRINSVVNNIQLEGLATIGEAIGTALAGGDMKDAFQTFGNILATGLTAIGKELIVMSGVIKAIKIALKGSLNAPALLAGGIALIAIAAALRATLNKGISGFAQGGLVFGPTLGLIGEGVGTTRSNPEVIAPLDQLKKMLGDTGGNRLQPIVLRTAVRGDNLLLIQHRTTRRQGRTR